MYNSYVYKHLMTNAYARSGSVFTNHFLKEYKIKSMPISSTHVASAVENENINHIVVIRNPYECISSYLYMTHLSQQISEEIVRKYADEYLVHIDYYYRYKDKPNVYGIDFVNLSSDPYKATSAALDYFGIKYNTHPSDQDLKNMFAEVNLNEDRVGHIPRQKTERRREIEEYVQSLDFMSDVFNEYTKVKEFLK